MSSPMGVPGPTRVSRSLSWGESTGELLLRAIVFIQVFNNSTSAPERSILDERPCVAASDGRLLLVGHAHRNVIELPGRRDDNGAATGRCELALPQGITRRGMGGAG